MYFAFYQQSLSINIFGLLLHVAPHWVDLITEILNVCYIHAIPRFL